MSLKLIEISETSLGNPESSGGVQQKRMKSTWSFNLHKRVPIGADEHQPRKDEQIRKNLVRKFYGKKILYVTKFQDANAIVSRSKLLKYVEVDDVLVIHNNLKSKGNLVIFSYSFESSQAEDDLEHKKRLLFKKILRNCQKAKIQMLETPDITLFKYLLATRNLTITMNKEFELASIGGILGKFLRLETLKMEPVKYNGRFPLPKDSKSGFFRSLHKLSYLQKVKLNINSQNLQNVSMKHEIDKLYSQPLKFGFSITITCDSRLELNEETSLVKILNRAEYLSLSDSKDQKKPFGNEDLVSLAKEEKKMMKIGSKKNIVRIYSQDVKARIDAIKILSYCNSLKYLYIRKGRYEHDVSVMDWKKIAFQEEIKGFQNLENAVLEFQSFDIENELEGSEEGSEDELENMSDDIVEEKESFLPPFAAFYQIKEKCPSLQHFSLYLINWWFPSGSENEAILPCIDNFKQFIQEVSRFDKLKAFGLVAAPENVPHFSISELLSNKSLESFQLKFRQNLYSSTDLDLDRSFVTDQKSEIKKLIITIPTREKVPLFGINLLNYTRKLDNLQVVELIDKNLELITFDFLYGFVTSLLDKKDMRKILICTKVTNNFYSGNFGIALSTSLGAQLRNMLNEISQDWESRVGKLKESQLEEIFVGKLQGYSFDYLLYNKELRVTEKLFWTQNEMDQLLSKKEQLTKRYGEIFELFKPKETPKEESNNSDSDSDSD